MTDNPNTTPDQTPHPHQSRARPDWFRAELERLGDLFDTAQQRTTAALACDEGETDAQSHPKPDTDAELAQPAGTTAAATADRYQPGVSPPDPETDPEAELEGFRTTDGRPFAWLPPEEQTMVKLSLPGRVNGYLTGENREKLARLLADRYKNGASLLELAGLLNRTTKFVRNLVAETGTPIRPKGRPAGFTPAVTEIAGTRPVGEPRVWTGRPEPMQRVQPDDLDWAWTDHHVYTAELIVDLYVQGRSYTEVAAVTGYPADDIRAMALAAGVARPNRVEEVYAAWRQASRETLAKMHRTTLLLAWLDGAEVEDLADAHHVPADLLWDLIADELARTTKRALAYLTSQRNLGPRPACAGTVCLFACAHTCVATIPGIHSIPESVGPGRSAANGSWPPRADLGDRITVNDDGTVSWKSFANPTT